jgi:transposase-like protein
LLTIDPGAGPCTGKAHGSTLDAQSLAFKKQIVQEYAAGAALNGLARQHDLSRNLISTWVAESEAGGFDPDLEAANRLHSASPS